MMLMSGWSGSDVAVTRMLARMCSSSLFTSSGRGGYGRRLKASAFWLHFVYLLNLRRLCTRHHDIKRQQSNFCLAKPKVCMSLPRVSVNEWALKCPALYDGAAK